MALKGVPAIFIIHGNKIINTAKGAVFLVS